MLLPTFILTILSILGLASAATASSKLAVSPRAIAAIKCLDQDVEGKMNCGHGVSTCSVNSKTGVSTALTCYHGTYLKAGKCPDCPAGKFSPWNNHVKECSVCPGKGALSCVIRGPDFTCRSGYYLKECGPRGPKCTACKGGYSTKEGNSATSCTECGTSSFSCNLNVSPVVPLVCLHTYALTNTASGTDCIRILNRN